MTKVRRPFDLTTTAQVAAVASIDGGAEIDRRRAINAEGLERLAEILTEHGFDPVPSVGNFVYVDVGDATELFERLLQRRRDRAPARRVRIAERDPCVCRHP